MLLYNVLYLLSANLAAREDEGTSQQSLRWAPGPEVAGAPAEDRGGHEVAADADAGRSGVQGHHTGLPADGHPAHPLRPGPPGVSGGEGQRHIDACLPMCIDAKMEAVQIIWHVFL